jgi:L-alanine-DL-glutamate epimerase-like enolase superfamily enzyme
VTEALTIESLEATPIRAPLGREYHGSTYHMTHRATVLVRLETAEGVVGEAYAGDEDATLAELVDVIRTEVAPRLVGEDAMAVERCWEAAYPVTFDILRDRRIGLVALAAADLAVWDAVGKALGQPLWRLWGGYRDTVELIAIGGYYDAPEPIGDEIAGYREMGLAGCKFKVGGATPAQDAERVLAAREAGGDGFVLMIDANQGYEVPEAIELCRLLEGAGIRWFEEPCRWHNDRRGLRDVRAIGGLPVCAGQTELSVSGCRDLMEAGAVDVCNFDSSWSGGPTAWRRCAAVAHAYDVAMGHHEEPQVALHLIASQSHGTYAECFHPDRDPFWWNLIANRPDAVDGRVQLPDGPGLGWELDRDYIDFHRADR